MTDVVNIRVLFFGAARDAVEANQLDLALEAPATVASAFQSLKMRFSTLERFGRSLLFAVKMTRNRLRHVPISMMMRLHYVQKLNATF